VQPRKEPMREAKRAQLVLVHLAISASARLGDAIASFDLWRRAEFGAAPFSLAKAPRLRLSAPGRLEPPTSESNK
jgi:hypothetical protein